MEPNSSVKKLATFDGTQQFSQETHHIWWNPKVYHCVHNNLPIAPILSHAPSLHVLTSYFCKIHFNIIL